MTELTRDARALIQQVGNADGPTARDRERVRGALARALAAGAAVALTSASAGAGASTSAAAGLAAVSGKTAVGSWLGLLGKGGGPGVAAWFLIGSATGLAVTVPIGSYTRAPERPAIASPASPVAKLTDRTLPAPQGTRSAAPVSRPASPAAAPPRSASRMPDPRAGVSEAPPLPDSFEGASGPPSRAFDDTGISGELALLKRAQHELTAGRASVALGLLDQHESRYPHGALTLERMGVRVFALCALGRNAEARAAADRLIASAPDSPLVPRVRASCASSPRETANVPVDSQTDVPRGVD